MSTRSQSIPKIQSRIAPQGAVEILIYEELGWGFFEDGYTAKQFKRELDAAGPDIPVHLRINSPGGTVSDGLAIYNLIRLRGNVTAFIDGYAASAMSFVPLACDERISPKSSLWMVHEPWDIAIGPAKELRHQASVLDQHLEAMLDIYTSRTGNSEAQVREWLDAEVWWTGEEALQHGFATSLGAQTPDLSMLLSPWISDRVGENSPQMAKAKAIGWIPASRIAASATIPNPQQQKEQEKPVDDALKQQFESQIQAATNDLQDLQAKLAERENQMAALAQQQKAIQDRLAGETTVATYWQLRSRAISLYSMENKLTEEEFESDFSKDPQADIEKFKTMDPEEASFELRYLDRSLRKAALRNPIDRVKDEGDRAMLNNTKIESHAGDVPLESRDMGTPHADRFLEKNNFKSPY